MAPVSIGQREFADVILPPFEMAIREGGARAVMHSYADIDGVPADGRPRPADRLLREELGFDGLVVSDYYAISFLETPARRGGSAARSRGGRAARRGRHGAAQRPLLRRAAGRGRAAGRRPEAARRPGRRPGPGAASSSSACSTRAGRRIPPALATPTRRRQLRGPGRARPGPGPAGAPGAGPAAGRGVGYAAGQRGRALPAARGCAGSRRRAACRTTRWRSSAATACPGTWARRIRRPRRACRSPRCWTALRGERVDVSYAAGCDGAVCDTSRVRRGGRRRRGRRHRGRRGRGRGGAVRPRHLRRGLRRRRPAVAGRPGGPAGGAGRTGTPVVAVLVTGRPYALGAVAGRLAGIVQAFFPGEEGGRAIAGVLSGRIVPSGKLPVEMPATAAALPSSYLRSRLAGPARGSSVDPVTAVPVRARAVLHELRV